MAYELPVGQLSFEATTGLTQYTAVFINSSGKLTKASTTGKVIGILVSSGTTGKNGAKPQTVQLYGVAKWISGSTLIAVGDILMASTSNGKAQVVTAGNYGYGIALAAAVSTSTHEVLPVLIMPTGATAAL